MILNWIKCETNQWCNFFNLNLGHSHFDGLDGVYIIWHGAPNPAVVYVGQGNIRDRLTAHRNEPAIIAFGLNYALYVTWASVPVPSRNGVERFLADIWNPLVGDSHPQAIPIPVNQPF